MRTQDELIKTIKEFIGKGGYVPFEHGFRPKFNACGVAFDHIDLRVQYKGKRQLYLTDMTVDQLTEIIIDLMQYQNYCHLYA